MTESEIRAYAWKSSIKHVIAAIEEEAAEWTPNGPSRATADRIVNKIRAMRVPGPTGDQQ